MTPVALPPGSPAFRGGVGRVQGAGGPDSGVGMRTTVTGQVTRCGAFGTGG
ncbi:hypothetical protein KPATCC21470_3565 [Kitasatospora purpeofusca]